MAIITISMPRNLETNTKVPHTKTYSDDTVIYKLEVPNTHVTKVLQMEKFSESTLEDLMNKLHDQIETLGMSDKVKESYNNLALDIQNEQ